MIACKNIHSESEVRLDTLQDGNLLIKTCASSTPKTTACTVINKSRIHTNHNKTILCHTHLQKLEISKSLLPHNIIDQHVHLKNVP